MQGAARRLRAVQFHVLDTQLAHLMRFAHVVIPDDALRVELPVEEDEKHHGHEEPRRGEVLGAVRVELVRTDVRAGGEHDEAADAGTAQPRVDRAVDALLDDGRQLPRFDQGQEEVEVAADSSIAREEEISP